MIADKPYALKALTHRGHFTETFAYDRLQQVFGNAHVHANIDIFKTKGQKLSEIDVLVLFGDRAIVLQAKSKRLTLAAQKGNDLQLKDDFKKAVQDAYDQARVCAAALADPTNCQFYDAKGNSLEITSIPKVVYPMCIVADLYPALNFQARQFLKTDSTDTILQPLITDVFVLDAIAEMLNSPLRFLNYIDLRARYDEKILTSNEHAVLGFHLKNGLWFDPKFDIIALDETISVDLDVAMLVRRAGVAGAATPEGHLTRFEGTAVGRLIVNRRRILTPDRHAILTPGAGVCSRPAAKRGAIWRSAARSRRAHPRRGRLKLCS